MQSEHQLLIAMARILESPYTHLKDLADSAETKLKALVGAPADAAGNVAGSAGADLQALAEHVTGALGEKLKTELEHVKAGLEQTLADRVGAVKADMEKALSEAISGIDQRIATRLDALVEQAAAAENAPVAKAPEPAPAA